MSMKCSVLKQFQLGGKTFNESRQLSGDLAPIVDENLAAAKTGTLTTRTSNSVGTLTMTTGHGIQTGDRLDLYWDGGQRRGITVGTVSVNSVPFTLGAGDNLPLVNTVITAMVPTVKVITFTGSNLVALLFWCQAYSQFVLTQSDNTEIFATVIEGSGKNTFSWDEDCGYTNPVSGTVGKLYLSHNDSGAAQPMRAGILLP